MSWREHAQKQAIEKARRLRNLKAFGLREAGHDLSFIGRALGVSAAVAQRRVGRGEAIVRQNRRARELRLRFAESKTIRTQPMTSQLEAFTLHLRRRCGDGNSWFASLDVGPVMDRYGF